MGRSSKKAGMSKWKQGQTRRSPRISALDASSAQQSRRVPPTSLPPQPKVSQVQVQAQAQAQAQAQGPAFQSRTRRKIIPSTSTSTRASKLRKLRPLQDVAATATSRQQPIDVHASHQQSHEDHAISSDQPTSHCGHSPNYDDKAASPDQLSSVPSTKRMPEKGILELILDILQRRDAHEIFAEPVDPEEVEDYYEIIKEPMDFGTMRAKLHEGMYTSFQQFEHDVYLITRNAMHFNSSTTIYFRQARAIHELSKKVFHALKTDPENFKLEFSETRRRASRRLMGEARASSYCSSSKLETNTRPNSKTNVSTKSMPCFLRNSSNLRKNITGNYRHSGAATDLSAKDHEVRSGAINGSRNSFAEVNRHCAYTPSMSLLSEKDSIFSTVYSDSKPLIPVNQQDISYRDSLMFFVKGLGPTAQMIAKRKLIGCSVDASNCWSPVSKHLFQQPECQNLNAFCSTQKGLPLLDSAFTAESENLFGHLHRGPNISRSANCKVETPSAGLGEKACVRNLMVIPNVSVKVTSSSDEGMISVAFGGDAQSSHAVDGSGLFGCDSLNQDQCSEILLNSYPSSVSAGELNPLIARLKNSGKNSEPIVAVKSNYNNQAPQLESCLAQSQENMLDLKLTSKQKVSPFCLQQTMGSSICSETKGSTQYKKLAVVRGAGRDIIAQDGVEVGDLVEAGQELKEKQAMGGGSSQFIFDLPFLRKQLDQLSSFGKDKISQRGSGSQKMFVDKINWKRQLGCSHHKEDLLLSETYKDSYKQLSLDAQQQRGDIALQERMLNLA